MGGTVEAPSDRQVISDLRKENEALRRILAKLAHARSVKALKDVQQEAREHLDDGVPRPKSIFWNRWDNGVSPPRLRTVRGKMKTVPQYGGDGLYYLMEGSYKVNELEMRADDARERNRDRKRHGIKSLWFWSGKK